MTLYKDNYFDDALDLIKDIELIDISQNFVKVSQLILSYNIRIALKIMRDKDINSKYSYDFLQ